MSILRNKETVTMILFETITYTEGNGTVRKILFIGPPHRIDRNVALDVSSPIIREARRKYLGRTNIVYPLVYSDPDELGLPDVEGKVLVLTQSGLERCRLLDPYGDHQSFWVPLAALTPIM